jgi:hypothetical protein
MKPCNRPDLFTSVAYSLASKLEVWIKDTESRSVPHGMSQYSQHQQSVLACCAGPTTQATHQPRHCGSSWYASRMKWPGASLSLSWQHACQEQPSRAQRPSCQRSGRGHYETSKHGTMEGKARYSITVRCTGQPKPPSVPKVSCQQIIASQTSHAMHVSSIAIMQLRGVGTQCLHSTHKRYPCTDGCQCQSVARAPVALDP